MIVDQINEILFQRLQKSDCTTGHLTCEVPGTALITTLHGYKFKEDKPVYFWDWEPSFKKLVWAYMESFQPELAAFTVEVDVAKQLCRYHNTNTQQYKEQQQADYKKEEMAAKRKQVQYKQQLALQKQPIGLPLAQAVVTRLITGAQFGYIHRDYCGTGLQSINGQFEYIELWDYAVNVIKSFTNEADFVQWLSQQSDASLSQLDAASPFLLGKSDDY